MAIWRLDNLLFFLLLWFESLLLLLPWLFWGWKIEPILYPWSIKISWNLEILHWNSLNLLKNSLQDCHSIPEYLGNELQRKIHTEWKQRSTCLTAIWRLYFYPAKFDNFKNDKMKQSKNLLDWKPASLTKYELL